MRKLFVLAVLVIAALLTVTGLGAQELPCGFVEVEQIVTAGGTVGIGGIKIIQRTSADDFPANMGGTIEVVGATGPAAIGFGIGIRDSNRVYIMAIVIFRYTDGTYEKDDMLTGQSKKITEAEACLLADTWLKTYHKSLVLQGKLVE